MDRLRLGIGQVRQRGWTFDDKGGSFTVFSKHAERIELAVLHPTEAKEEARISLERNGDEHSVVLSGARPGLRYGLRAHGVYDVSQGHRFDGSKFLIDPYAFGLQGEASYDGPILSSDRIGGASTFGRDSFGSTPISIARDRRESSLAPPPMTRRPGVPWEQTVLYECSVETLTKRHPHVTRAEQGKFLGLASDPMLEHFRAMGITTVELLPVMASLTEPAIALRGRRNLWGYNTLGYFVPDARFVVDPSRGAGEFVEMVNRLHDAGFEVVLDRPHTLHLLRRTQARCPAHHQHFQRVANVEDVADEVRVDGAYPRAAVGLFRHQAFTDQLTQGFADRHLAHAISLCQVGRCYTRAEGQFAGKDVVADTLLDVGKSGHGQIITGVSGHCAARSCRSYRDRTAAAWLT